MILINDDETPVQYDEGEEDEDEVLHRLMRASLLLRCRLIVTC